MYLELRTPDKVFFEGDIKAVNLPGSDGSFEILNQHAAIISLLTAGRVTIKSSEKQYHCKIDTGLVEMHANRVIVLVESVTQFVAA